MNKIDITVVIPIYNVGKYLDEMLKSIYNQTFKNFQVIIVNDGSTDNSEEIIFNYINRYSNIIYIKQVNSGVSEARNKALSKIKGKYTIFLDPDDYIEKDMLEQLYNKSEQNSSDITICGYKIFYEKIDKEDSNVLFNIDENRTYTNKVVMEMVLNNEIIGFLWNKLFLTENLEKYNMHFLKDRYSQDWMPVFEQISLANKITFINKPLYNYRIRANSNSHNKDIKRVEDHNVAIKSIVKYILDKNIDLDKSKFYTFIITHQVMNIQMCAEDRFIKKRDMYKLCEIKKLKIFDILLDHNIILNWKIKFIGFKFKILHIYYKNH